MSSKQLPFVIYDGMSDTLVFTLNAELCDAYNFENFVENFLRQGYPETYRHALECVVKEKYQEMYSLMGSMVRFANKRLRVGTLDMQNALIDYHVIDISKELGEKFDSMGLS